MMGIGPNWTERFGAGRLQFATVIFMILSFLAASYFDNRMWFNLLWFVGLICSVISLLKKQDRGPAFVAFCVVIYLIGYAVLMPITE